MLSLPTPETPQNIGPYRIVTRLASGGMAEVFLAMRRGALGFERAVVLKRMLPHLASDPELCTTIVDEAKVLARIRHPNVVAIDDLGMHDGTYYLVLEYLRGESLSALVRRLRARGERLEPAVAAYVIGEICAGLHAAHELTDEEGRPLEVVHRDVSPQNVFVTFDGDVKVIDFGIARFTTRASAHTKTGLAKGKFVYMAPEQFSGESLDRRADVFAVGALLYELLTGERLFARDSDMQVLKAILQDPVAPPSERWPAIPATIDAVCLRALARPREERFPTALALRTALRELMPVVDPAQQARARLVELMHRVLADRWGETSELMRSARKPRSVPPSAPDRPRPEEVVTLSLAAVAPVDAPPLSAPEISVQVEHEPLTTDRRPRRATSGPRRAIVVAAATIVASAIGLGVLALMPALGAAPAGREGTPPIPPVARAPVAPPQPEPEATPQPSPTVRVHVATTPAGAELRSGERVLGITPCDLELERSTTPIEVTILLRGYEPARELIVPASDARVRVHLSRTLDAGPPPVRRGREPVFYSFD